MKMIITTNVCSWVCVFRNMFASKKFYVKEQKLEQYYFDQTTSAESQSGSYNVNDNESRRENYHNNDNNNNNFGDNNDDNNDANNNSVITSHIRRFKIKFSSGHF